MHDRPHRPVPVAVSAELIPIAVEELARGGLRARVFAVANGCTIAETLLVPKWGLTPEQREAEPWGLSKDLLSPAKQITDPIHGDIYLTKLEAAIVDSPAMQRLRRLRQLGTTHLVYPGATHTRFAHSLGALRVAQDLMDALLAHRSGPNPELDLFAVWKSQLSADEFEKRIAEAVVLARLGGLLHDMCHVAYGHTLEDDLGLLHKHDNNEARFEKCWTQLGPVREYLDPIKNNLTPLIISKAQHSIDVHYKFVEDVVGNTICADLLDYLVRDHRFTGLRMEYSDRFLASLYVVPLEATYCGGRVCIRLHHKNRIRIDIETELFKLLRYRYELTERVLTHHTKLAADAMLGKMFAELKYDEAAMEDLAFSHGDDGLLEHIATLRQQSQRAAEVAKLLLERKLHKHLCTVRRENCDPHQVYDKFGSPAKRQEVAAAAAKYVGHDPRAVAIWISHPDMRLKVARVLVNLNGQIKPLSEHDENTPLRQGQEIIDSHKRLWTMSVFVSQKLHNDREKAAVVVAFLSEKLGVTWEDRESVTAKVEDLARDTVAREFNLTIDQKERLPAQVAARGAGDTYEDLLETLRVTAKALQDGGHES